MPRSEDRQTLRDLGAGLVMRRGTSEDAEALAQFNGRIFGGGGTSDWLCRQTRDLMSGRHPNCKPRDFTLVEDTSRGKIVSSLCLISQQWSYAGVTFGVGRPDLVGTDPEYRRRGLVRAQFEVIHQWSARRGHLLQAMPGIQGFYRQFGYEPALIPGAGRRGHRAGVSQLRKGAEEPYRVRPAAETDLSFMARTYRNAMRRSLVRHVPSAALWRYCLSGRSVGEQFCIIETPRAEPVGMLAHYPAGWVGAAMAVLYELKPGANWLTVTPSMLRYLGNLGEEWLAFHLGTAHPAYEALPDFLHPWDDPYAYDAFHVRVPDLPEFLRLLAPVLEKRLAASIAVGWSGELRLNLSRDGVRLCFEKGRLAASEPWSPVQDQETASFRDLTFLQLLFGSRSLQELREASPECYACDHEARALLSILFPKRPSAVCTAF